MPTRLSNRPLFISGMYGLGDGVYQRPFVRAQAAHRPVYLKTPWPELYSDLHNVFPVRPGSMPYRTQAKNLARLGAFPWAQPPRIHDKANFSYALVRDWSILDELERHVGLADQPFVFDLPDFGPSPVSTSKPIAVIRPVTTRAEWLNVARAPHTEYIAAAAVELKQAGFHIVAIADIQEPHEWLEGVIPAADEYFIRGELAPRELFALMQHAGVIVGGSGFIIPAGIALRTPLVVIGGGQGGHNAPERVTDPRMDLSSIRFILPDVYCPCRDKKHACTKAISDFPRRFRQALYQVTPPWQEIAA